MRLDMSNLGSKNGLQMPLSFKEFGQKDEFDDMEISNDQSQMSVQNDPLASAKLAGS